jgi:hypothetical protein
MSMRLSVELDSECGIARPVYSAREKRIGARDKVMATCERQRKAAVQSTDGRLDACEEQSGSEGECTVVTCMQETKMAINYW